MTRSDEAELYRKELGRRLKSLRLLRGLKQGELATKAKTNQGQISAAENGDRGFSDVVKRDVAIALEVDVGFLDPLVTSDQEFDEALAMLKSGKKPSRPPITERLSGSPVRVVGAPIPEALQAYLDAHPALHPAVRHHLLLNHDLRTEAWVQRDETFWGGLAKYFSDRLGVPLEGQGGEAGESHPRPRKG